MSRLLPRIARGVRMPQSPPNSPPTRVTPMLRRSDQWVVGSAVGITLVAMATYWFVKGGHEGRLIDIDRATPLAAEFKVDVNSAEWPEFAQLPGIGETLAKRIVDARSEAGAFVDHDDLRLRVQGIGRVKLETLRPYLLEMPDVEIVAGK